MSQLRPIGQLPVGTVIRLTSDSFLRRARFGHYKNDEGKKVAKRLPKKLVVQKQEDNVTTVSGVPIWSGVLISV